MGPRPRADPADAVAGAPVDAPDPPLALPEAAPVETPTLGSRARSDRTAGATGPRSPSCSPVRSPCACGASSRACRSPTTPTRTATSCPTRSGCSSTASAPARRLALLRQPARADVPAALRVRGLVRRSRRRLAPLRRRPDERVRRRPRDRRAARHGVGVAAVPRRRAAVRPAGRAARRGAHGRRLPAGLLRPPGAQRRGHPGVRRARPVGRRRRAAGRALAPLHRRRGRAWGSPARSSTPAASSIVPIFLAALLRMGPGREGPRALAGLCFAGVAALAAFLVTNPYSVLDYSAFKYGIVHQSTVSEEAERQARRPEDRRRRLLPVVVRLGARLGALARRGRRDDRALVRSPAPAAHPRARRRAAAVPRLHGPAGSLLRPLAAARLPDGVPARRLLRRAHGHASSRAAGRCCARRCSRSPRWRCSARGSCTASTRA